MLFGIDATALSKSKPLKSLRGTFDRIAFLYPHVGLGEKDQSRNVCLNQKLLLGFFREAAHLLRDGDVPGRSKRRKQDELEDDVSDAEEDKEGSDAAPTERGQMLLVLRTGKPYDLWDVGCVALFSVCLTTIDSDAFHTCRALAKQGPLVISTLKLSGMKAVSQPTYMQIRSGIFNAEWYPGYEHRRTIGWDERFSTSSNADTQYSAKDRRKTESERGEKVKSRMWSFCVKEKNGT